MLLLYNCYLPSAQVLAGHNSHGQPIPTALGLNLAQWPDELEQIRLIDFRELTVPLVPGLSPAARCADMLVNLIVICEGPARLFDAWPRLCNTVTAGVLSGLRRSSVALVTASLSDEC